MKKVLRVMAYVSWFFTCFSIAAVLLFPLKPLRPLVEDQIEIALGKGKQGIHGTDPEVTIGDLSMSGLGVRASRVQIQMPSREPDPGPSFDVDTVRISASLLSALSDNKTLQLTGEMYGGDFSADVTLDPKGGLMAADVEVEGLELSKAPALIATVGVPVLGKLHADVQLDMGKAPEKDARGNVTIDVKGLGLGAGKLSLPMGMDFDVGDGITMGDLQLRMPVDKGQGTITGSFEGKPAVEASVEGTIILRSKLPTSRLDIDGWFRPTPEFLTSAPKIKSAIELGEQFGLGKAKDDEGRYHFSAKGVVQTLRPALSRDGGKRAGKK